MILNLTKSSFFGIELDVWKTNLFLQIRIIFIYYRSKVLLNSK